MQLRAEPERRAFRSVAKRQEAAIIRPIRVHSGWDRSSLEYRFRLEPRSPQRARSGVRGLRNSRSVRFGHAQRPGRLSALLADETGSATAEYAVATMAAVGFAGLLVLILRGDEVRGILTDLVRRALTVAN